MTRTLADTAVQEFALALSSSDVELLRFTVPGERWGEARLALDLSGGDWLAFPLMNPCETLWIVFSTRGIDPRLTTSGQCQPLTGATASVLLRMYSDDPRINTRYLASERWARMMTTRDSPP